MNTYLGAEHYPVKPLAALVAITALVGAGSLIKDAVTFDKATECSQLSVPSPHVASVQDHQALRLTVQTDLNDYSISTN